MTEDARFEDAGGDALRLTAESAEDIGVVAALVQDAVAKVGNVQYAPSRRRFSLLLYRFRWEDAEKAKKERRKFERVAAALTIDDVLSVRAAGIDPKAKETVLNILTMSFEAGEDGAGEILLACSDGMTLRLAVECVNLRLVDLTRPWAAGGEPQHF